MSRNTVRHFFQCLPRMNFTKDCFVGNQSLTYRSLPKITSRFRVTQTQFTVGPAAL